MESIILILITIVISYFISRYVILNYFTNKTNDDSSMLQILFGIVSFFIISYIISCVQKSGPQRAIFLESIVFLCMLPLLPFILLYRYIFNK